MAKTARQAYFIGANTARGFVNYADEIFSGIRKMYLIKGGPGTGKSTLMRQIAEAAERQGLTVECYHCSSDSTSLDGIVVRELSVGITDATAPHVMEARYPGAREELIDLGAFWDQRLLAERYERIKTLADEKAGLFASVYKYLGVGLVLRNERERMLAACTDGEKLDKAAARLIRQLGGGKGFCLLPRQVGALGMNGHTTLGTYEEMAERRFQILDARGLRGQLLDRILQHAERAGLTAMISRDPMLGTEALYFPEKGVAITETGDADHADKILNTERFILREKLTEQRRRLRFLAKLEGELMTRVEDLFGEIKTRHFALEGLYADAMDFGKLNAMTEELIGRIGL